MIGKAVCGSPKSRRKNPVSPMMWPPAPPKAKAKPTAQYTIAAIEKFVRILATTVPAFLPREKPISRKAKPACMNITKQPATITQSELMPDRVGQPLAELHRTCRPWPRLAAPAGPRGPKERHGSLGYGAWILLGRVRLAVCSSPVGASFARCRKIDRAVIRHPVEAPRPRGRTTASPILRRLDKVNASLPPLGSSCIPTHATQSQNQEDHLTPMARTRQQNVTAAQWTRQRRRPRRARSHRARQLPVRRERLQPRRPAGTPAQGRLQAAAGDARPRRGARPVPRRRRRQGDARMGAWRAAPRTSRTGSSR